MTNHRNKQNYRFRTWKFRDRCHLKGGVCQGCFLSLILNYLSQYIHFHSLYIMYHYYAKFKENPCVGTDASTPFKIIYICLCMFRPTSHPGSGSDRTIASEWQNTALATLYIGGSVTCS